MLRGRRFRKEPGQASQPAISFFEARFSPHMYAPPFGKRLRHTELKARKLEDECPGFDTLSGNPDMRHASLVR